MKKKDEDGAHWNVDIVASNRGDHAPRREAGISTSELVIGATMRSVASVRDPGEIR